MPEAISNGIVFFLVWLFAVAAIHKLRAPGYYLQLVSAYIPTRAGGSVLVWLVALGELSLAGLLLIPGLRRIGITGSAALLTAYAAMMAWQYGRGRGDLQCGCAGPASALTVGPALIVRNLVCACFALLALASPGAMPGSLGSAALALVMGVFMITVYLCSDQMIANAQAMAGEV